MGPKTIPDVEDKEYSEEQSLAALQDALASDPRIDLSFPSTLNHQLSTSSNRQSAVDFLIRRFVPTFFTPAECESPCRNEGIVPVVMMNCLDAAGSDGELMKALWLALQPR